MSYKHYDRAKNNLDVALTRTSNGLTADFPLRIAEINALLAIFDALKDLESVLKGEK